MDPLWLNFKDPQLEREYDSYLFHSMLSKSDELYVWYMCGFMTYSSLGSTPLEVHQKIYLVAALGIAFAMLWYRKQEMERKDNLRTTFVLGVRMFHQMMMAIARPLMCHAYALPEDSLQAVLRVLFVNDVPCFMITALMLRLKFKHHVIFNTQAMMVMLFSRVRTFCTCAMTSPGAPALLDMEKSVDSVIGEVSIYAHSIFALARGPREPYLPCYQVLVFIQIFFGVFVSAFMVWICERNSRTNFLKLMQRSDTRIVLPHVIDGKHGWFKLVINFVVLSIAVWEYGGWLPAAVQKWGILVADV